MKIIKKIAAVILAAAIAFTPVCGSSPAGDGLFMTAEAAAEFSAPVEGTRNGVNKTNALEPEFYAGNIVYGGTTFVYSFVPRHSVGIASNGTMVDIEAEYGITEVCKGTKITFSLFNYTDKKLKVKSAKVWNVIEMEKNIDKDITLSFSKKTKFETKKLPVGLYCITVTFSNKKYVDAYFYVTSNAVSTCIYERLTKSTQEKYIQCRKNLNKAIDNAIATGDFAIDGSLSLDTTKFWYPRYPVNSKIDCESQKWIDLSNQLVNKNWSKEHKAYVIYDWVIRNIAFDTYIVDKCNGKLRDNQHRDYSGKYGVWTTRTGKCFQYANILALMYRAQGIPTVQIGSDTFYHDWNMAYINGRWIELDASYYAKYETTGSDTTKRTIRTEEEDLYSYRNFRMFPDDEMDSASDMVINDELCYDQIAIRDGNIAAQYTH